MHVKLACPSAYSHIHIKFKRGNTTSPHPHPPFTSFLLSPSRSAICCSLRGNKSNRDIKRTNFPVVQQCWRGIPFSPYWPAGTLWRRGNFRAHVLPPRIYTLAYFEMSTLVEFANLPPFCDARRNKIWTTGHTLYFDVGTETRRTIYPTLCRLVSPWISTFVSFFFPLEHEAQQHTPPFTTSSVEGSRTHPKTSNTVSKVNQSTRTSRSENLK